MSKKFFLVMVIVVGAIIGLWSWTLVAPNNSISIGGSASVQPLLKKLTDKYKTEDGKKFVYSATGSGAGITNVQEGVYEIGFISKDVKPSDWKSNLIKENTTIFNNLKTEDIKNSEWYWNQLKETNQNGAIEDTYRYIEFAKDSIVFVYNDKGTGFDQFLEQSNLTFKFEIDNGKFVKDQTSYKILNAIYSPDSQNNLISWNKLAIMLAENYSDNDQQKEANIKLANQLVSSKTKITPYSSTSGSGTRSSFFNLTGIEPGSAVKEYGANGTIYGQIEKSPGSIGFVSMLYGSAESKTVKSVKIEQDKVIWDPSSGSSNLSTYPLTRPFIGIYKYSSANEKLMHQIANFLFWMATSEDVKDFYKSVGLTQYVVNEIK
ncbi:phosphate ABC transporter substrate-binding protein [Mesoplasma melaleucae]|uniref:Phosphate ABC transporter substrate-binding protein n=1 Tax=Mesoplasma melaleucae TaxID=81459 RepID=A0A2K8NVU3_9MOLU|nr:phosphate ABC transporter substrate-binding protein [Mesoplasma melaleucae]ATZ17864.1 phosphate ABC transporter substrate-binding protein [Mesoplasma melaleucae]